MTAKSQIKRVRTLYACFMGVITLCVALFFFNVITAEEGETLAMPTEIAAQYGVGITDLHSPQAVYQHEIALDGLADELTAVARVTSYEVLVMTDDASRMSDVRLTWCTWLQIFCVLLGIAVTVLVVLALISFYRNAKFGHVFPQRNIIKLRWVGILIIVMSMGMDVSSYLERSLAADLLAGSEWQPEVGVSVHVTRIILGLTIIFLAEIFSIGQKMQEEQELTI